MRAAVRDRYGPPELVRVVEVEKPAVKDRDVLVRVHATTVNRTDCGLRAAKPWIYRLFLGLRRPRRTVLGTEFAGEVEAVGDGVTTFKVGDRVFGFSGTTFGAHAEFLVMPEEGSMMATIPEGLTFEEAAPGSEGSHYALSSIRAAKVRRGQDVLVYGATGAIGSAAVQLLKQLGATSRLPARRATRVPYRRVNHGAERTTTVTVTTPMTSPCPLYQLERIPRICLIRMRPLVQVQPGPLKWP
jgi:NADPH:quinone reductase-like Zn-dependent oxidoreductase